MLDSAVRANRKHMVSIQSAVSKMVCEAVKDQTQPPPAPSQPASPQAALEQGNHSCMQMFRQITRFAANTSLSPNVNYLHTSQCNGGGLFIDPITASPLSYQLIFDDRYR